MARGRKASLTPEWLEETRISLKALQDQEPEKNNTLTKQAAIELLAAEIKALMDRGYSLDQIVRSVNHRGETFTSASLRTYLKAADDKASGRSATTVPPDRAIDRGRQRASAAKTNPKPDRGQNRAARNVEGPNPSKKPQRSGVKTKEEHRSLASAGTSPVLATEAIPRTVQTGGSFALVERKI